MPVAEPDTADSAGTADPDVEDLDATVVAGPARRSPPVRLEWGWALRPSWILLHVAVLLAVLGMLRAAYWQWDRLHQAQATNALIASGGGQEPVDVAALLPVDATPEQIEALKYRRVTMTGTYATGDQVLIRGRSNHTAPGYHVVTPLVLEDGTAVVVNRGWIPLLLGDGDPATFAPPAGPARVIGFIDESRSQEGLAVADPAEGKLDKMARIDVPRIQQQSALRLRPAYVQLAAQEPAPVTINHELIPDPVPPPAVDEQKHINYIGQWAIFAVLTCIVYPLFLRRTAKAKARERLHGNDAVG